MTVEADRLVPYDQGNEIAAALQALDGPKVNPVCRTRLYSHGGRTDRSLLLLHGFTNCPMQFDMLGREFFERGWNVLIPRYPRHGYTDRFDTSIAELRAQHLIAVAERSALAAAGLGRSLTVAGMSLGGSLAAYLAQTSPHVERAVLIAPMFGLKLVPGRLHPALAYAAYGLPNFFLWWDWRLKAGLAPEHGYPRLSSRAYAALFRIAGIVTSAARKDPPRAGYIGVVTNAAEPGLQNRSTYRLVEAWRRHGASVDTFEFGAAERLPHDLIDPVANPPSVLDRAYPVVRRFVGGS